ncbi:MAG: bifunctional hydroxymethylpyrimidine kinase/phosphomethylpyrimidine kinase [Candidatus Aramenus sp.]|jgi:hydroxymethylpyrimidine kinase/phosphomethylpyrimidine kinase|nr:bifunctional hydroxymethylpyrimidine kinase/phosphomethylpyrimidine kinase [Candidatus Aramenus sp.]
MRKRPVVLTIAGSDSGGGAGLQADLKTFTALGVFGTTVVTGLTAQNTLGVTKILEVPLDFIEAQFDVVMNDLEPKFAKTGMLASKGVMGLVARKVREYKLGLVYDPVMVAKSGDPLVTEDVIPAVKELIHLATVVTPNKYEAERILGKKIESLEDLRNSAREFYKTFSANVVVKGGSALGGVDYAVIDGEEIELKGDEIKTKNTHGTGDIFSASITAFLAKGYDLKRAILEAKDFVTKAIKFSLYLGKGHGPADPFAPTEMEVERERAREEAEKLVEYLEENKEVTKKLIDPEEKLNLGVMTSYGEVATLAGGIIRYIDWIKVDGPIVVNYYTNLVTEVLRDVGKRVGLSVSMSDRILKLAERGAIRISESGINADVIMRKGRAVIVANSLEEVKRLIEVIVNDPSSG